jgi:hypothetical protein
MEYRISEQLLWTWSMTKTHRFKILLYILFGIAGMAIHNQHLMNACSQVIMLN